MKKNTIGLLFWLGMLLLLVKCAQVQAPIGGQVDSIPATAVKYKPANRSNNFEGEKLSVEFSEFVSLDGVQEKFMVSPPMDKKPEIKLNGKKVTVYLVDSLKKNVTYTLDFKDAIVDYTEGNPTKDFQLVFSTGEVVDSLCIGGVLRDAFNLEPKESVYVMLYKEMNDTIPAKVLPEYISKTNKEGYFSIKNIRPANYYIFAVQDNNYNYFFDTPNENIAFLNKTLKPWAEQIVMHDTIQLDSLGADGELLKHDSLVERLGWVFYPDSVELFLFEEDYKKQLIVETKRNQAACMEVYFQRKLESLPEFEPLNFSPKEGSILVENDFDPKVLKNDDDYKDKLLYWITDSLLYKQDSLQVAIHFETTDSLMQTITQVDTVFFWYDYEKELADKEAKLKAMEEPKNKKGKGRGRKKKEKSEEIQLNLNCSNGRLDIMDSVQLQFKIPLLNVDVSGVQLSKEINDSTQVPVKFRFEPVDGKVRTFNLSAKYEPEESYQLMIPKGAFTDLYGLSHDTITSRFTVLSPDDYSTLFVDLTGITKPVIVQLLDQKSEVPIVEKFLKKNQKIEFINLKSSAFRLKLIVDDNNNKKWDTGDFEDRKLPERVYYYEEKIELKKGFDTQLSWHIEIP